MVESDSDTENVEITGHNFSWRGSQRSGLPRDPSFSGWCDEDEASPTDDRLENVDQSVEDFHFELPLLQQGELEKGPLDVEIGRCRDFQQKSMQMNGGTINDRFPGHDMRNGNGKYVAFDIEDGPGSDQSFSNVGDNGFNMDNTRSSQSNRRSSIAAADILKTLILILVWYTFSTLLTLYNKTLLGDDLGKFPAPLLMNAIHFTIQAVLSKAITWCWSQRFQPSVPMTWRDYFLRVVPTALGTAMDINLSNASLVFISVTFATMCKSAAPIFLLLFAFAFRLESPSFKLLGIILVISIGVLLTVAKETEFEFWGFIFVMLAAVMSGFRWCMTQILLQKEIYGLKNPLTLMSYVAPVMAVATALLSLLLDPWDEFRKSSYFNSSWHITQSCLLMLFGGTLAFFMVLTEYVLVSVTSAVTVTIAGVVKEAVTILVAVLYFQDQFTWLKGVGLIIIMFGVSLFNWYKYQKLQKGELGEKNLGTTNAAAKYVILEELDDQEDSS